MEENNKDNDKKFAVKLNLSGYTPDKIKVQLRGQELTVTGKQRSEEDGLQRSRDYHRHMMQLFCPVKEVWTSLWKRSQIKDEANSSSNTEEE